MTTRAGARFRLFRWFLALFVLLCTLTGVLSEPVSAAAHRTAEATPATGLGDQVVKVTWQGFKPTRDDGTFGVVVMQCGAHPKSVLRDCNTAETFPLSLTGNQQQGTTAANGTGSAFVDIMTTARLPSLACSETHPCSLMLYEITANGFDPNTLPHDAVIVPLSFRKSFGDCPPVKEFDVRMETEASAAPALYQWAADFCTGPHAFTTDVTNTSSNAAREDFFNNEIDIGVTSLPPEPGEVPPTGPKYSVVPLDLTGVVIAYNITDSDTNKQITDLTLTPRLVARLLSDSDVGTFFSDPEFLELNPHHAWPIEAADPGLRAEQNADTWIVTNWVNGNREARKFLNGNDRYHVPVNPAWLHVKYPTDVFAARNPNGVYFPRVGEEAVAERLFAETKPADSVPTDPLNAGFFAVLDLPTAARFNLPVARLTNGVGQPVVSLDPASLAAGFSSMTSTWGFHVEPAAPTDPGAYPLTKVDEALVPRALDNSAKDLRIRALLDDAVGPGQSVLPPGYAALPDALMLQTLRYTGDLPAPTTTTTTTTTPTPAPASESIAPLDRGNGYNGYGGSSSTSTPTTPRPTAASAATATTKVAIRRTPARFVALRLSDTGDRLVVPIGLGIALLALVGCAADGVRRRSTTLLRAIRLRRRRSSPLGGQSSP